MTDGAEPGGAGSVRSLRMLFEAGEPQQESTSPGKPVPKPKPGTVKGPGDSSPAKQETERPQTKPKPEVRPKVNKLGPAPNSLPAADMQGHVFGEAGKAADKKTNTESTRKEKASSPAPVGEAQPLGTAKRTDIHENVRPDLPAEVPPAIPRRPHAATPVAPAPIQAKRDDSPRALAPEHTGSTNTNLLDDTPLNEPPKAIPKPKHTQTSEKRSTERRPAPQPPSAQPAAPPARYNACFEAVCTRSATTEPKVTPATVSFVWARSKLPSAELAEVWDTVSNADPSCTGLDRAQFTCALALIDAKLDLAQTEKALQAPRAPQAPPLPRRPAP